MENTAKKTTKTAPKNTNLVESVNEKVKATAEFVNTQVTDAANDIAEDLKNVGEELQKVAVESVKKVTKKADLSKTVKKASGAARKVQKEIADTAGEIVEEVLEKGREWKDNTAKVAKEAIEKADLSDRLNDVKKSAAKANAYALSSTEELIEAVVENGAKWQNVTEKALKSGLQLAERQQNIVFNTLEAVKGQLGVSANRLKKLFR